MKNLFKKMSVLLLGLVTLVSCSGTYNSNKTFEYANGEEVKTALNNATYYDGSDKGGIYTINLDEGDFKDFDVKYMIHDGIKKSDKDKVSKNELKVSSSKLVVETIFTTLDKDGKKLEYYVMSKEVFDKDYLIEAASKNELQIAKGLQVYKNLEYTAVVTANKRMFTYVASNISLQASYDFAARLVAHLKYTKIGQ